MNRDQARTLLPILEQWVRGRQVEYQYKDSYDRSWYRVTETDDWNLHAKHYRVTPEPREFWIHASGDSFYGIVNHEDPDCGDCIKVREVIE